MRVDEMESRIPLKSGANYASIKCSLTLEATFHERPTHKNSHNR
jgi:hypothetical protein